MNTTTRILFNKIGSHCDKCCHSYYKSSSDQLHLCKFKMHEYFDFDDTFTLVITTQEPKNMTNAYKVERDPNETFSNIRIVKVTTNDGQKIEYILKEFADFLDTIGATSTFYVWLE